MRSRILGTVPRYEPQPMYVKFPHGGPKTLRVSFASMTSNKRPTQQRALSAHVLKLDFTDGSTVDVPEFYNTSLSVKWDFKEKGSDERVTWLQQILKGSKEPRTPEPNPTPHPRHRHRPCPHPAPPCS